MLAARQRARSPSDSRSMRRPAISISPASGRSMPPSRLSSVVLPDPEGPMTAAKSPGGIARLSPSKMLIGSLPLLKPLRRLIKRTSGVSDMGSPVKNFAAQRAEEVSTEDVPPSVSSRNVTLMPMSGRMRGSFCLKPMRTLTVAFSRLAVGTMAMTEAGMVHSG